MKNNSQHICVLLLVFLTCVVLPAQSPFYRFNRRVDTRMEKNFPAMDPMNHHAFSYHETISESFFFPELIWNSHTAIVSDFLVNDNTGSSGINQFCPAISSDRSGNFVVAWLDWRNGEVEIYAQRYSKNGCPLGNNFRVMDDLKSNLVSEPSVATDADGNFIITWEDNRNGDFNIYAQCFDCDGKAKGKNIRINHVLLDSWQESEYPAVAADSNGNFMIVWSEFSSKGADIYGQCLSCDGDLIGHNFKISDDKGSDLQVIPSVAADGAGNFIVAWQDVGFGYDHIYVQRVTKSGKRIDQTNIRVDDAGGKIRLWSPTPVSADKFGNFMIAWVDIRNGNRDIFAQRFNNKGIPLGNNFKVNDDPGNNDQFHPSIAIDKLGTVILVWGDLRNGDEDIYAQFYQWNGTPLGGNFKLSNDSTNANQSRPTVTASQNGWFAVSWDDDRNKQEDIYTFIHSGDPGLSDKTILVNDDLNSSAQENSTLCIDSLGNFVITWADGRNGTRCIYVQRFSNDAAPLGENFMVNGHMGSFIQGTPSVACDQLGNFIITWYDHRYGTSDIFCQRYTHDGATIGENFKVNENQNKTYQWGPALTCDREGDFVIVWTDSRNDLDNYKYDIYAQRFNKEGEKLGHNFKVNDDSWNADQKSPAIASSAKGDFIIVWQDARKGNWDIYAQRFLNDGSPVGHNFRVNDDQGSKTQKQPCVSMNKEGRIVIAWRDFRLKKPTVFAQIYDHSGNAVGNNFIVSDTLENAFIYPPSVSMADNGDFVIAWTILSNGNRDVYGQRFDSQGNKIGLKFRIPNTSNQEQYAPDIHIWNNRIYTTWTDTRLEGRSTDIWANILDWDDPTHIGKARDEKPFTFQLEQNYPNPFNPVTAIRYRIGAPTHVRLTVYNLLGQTVQYLVDQNQKPGDYTVNFDASHLPAGLYLYQLSAREFTEVKKMVLVK